MWERGEGWRRDLTRKGIRGAGACPTLWVPRTEVAADGERQVQCLVEVMVWMVSDREEGREDPRGLRVKRWGWRDG